ncbi:hypothetical protein TD95_004374 [Thielaviopsis punctulata]|uniref:MMS19 nucleotide excision repair protein n=1 Tax=Thielaviopsis punctulata TaxID=72032 RepID=A0A0F4ZIR5_9PEZI|nr:hypothetical protein TD95_004374 [Thielaviopsis punctulata]
MADFDQLALKFVLEDEHPVRDALAAEAADAIKNAPRASNPVRRWVESVRPWILGDDADGSGSGSGDRIARARALDFLSTTLSLLDKDLLRQDQIKVLIAYFSSMFTIDHRSGILPSAKALSTLTHMKFFPVDAAANMLHSVCSMADDFRNQIPVTRLAVYDLFATCLSNSAIAADLRAKQAADPILIREVLAMCHSERDPKNIMRWFGLLAVFLADFAPLPADVSQEIFATFSAYFPISLRTSQHPSGITAEDLKTALRKCFIASPEMAEHAFPFLLGKIEQGSGVTVNVKLDIIRTLEAGIKSYTPSSTKVAPFADRIWSALKYEVRNGDVDETIDATLDLFTTLAKTLDDSHLQTFVLSVLRECTDDLSGSTYAAGAGKVLVALMRAKFSAFAPLVAPTVNHVRDTLRHSKSPEHSSALLTLLNSTLAIRLLYLQRPEALSADEQAAFKAVDPTFAALYETTLKKLFAETANTDPNKTAVQALGLLASQPSALDPDALLLSESTCRDITVLLATLLVQPALPNPVAQDTVEALQRIVVAWPPAFDILADAAFSPERDTADIPAMTALFSRVAFIACSGLPARTRSVYLTAVPLVARLVRGLVERVEATQKNGDLAHPMWAVYITGLQAALMHFADACKAHWPRAKTLGLPEGVSAESWVAYVEKTFPSVVPNGPTTTDIPDAQPSDTAHMDTLLLGLYAVRVFFQLTLTLSPSASVVLAAPFADSSDSSRRFLFFLGQLTTHVIGQLTETQQRLLALHDDVFLLFHSAARGATYAHVQAPEHFVTDVSAETYAPLVAPACLSLSTAVLHALYPSVVAALFATGAGQTAVAHALTTTSTPADPAVLAYWLTVLANKHTFETTPLLHSLLCARLAALHTSPAGAPAAFGLLAGALRRYTGTSLSSPLAALALLPAAQPALPVFFDYLFAPKPLLTAALHCTTKPTWSQRAYLAVLAPLLPGVPAGPATLALLSAAQHLSFSVVRDDAPALVRCALAALAALPAAQAAGPGLAVLQHIMAASPDLIETHARSAIDACLRVAADSDKSVPAAARRSALVLVSAMPEKFDHRHLVAVAPRVKRALAVASGDRVRGVRGVATKARMTWATVDA